jgi:hypothetical protein
MGDMDRMSDPLFDNVLSLIHFDDDIVTDVVASAWTATGVVQSGNPPLYGTGCLGNAGAGGSKLENTIALDWNQPFTIECSVLFDSPLTNSQGSIFNGGSGTDDNRIQLTQSGGFLRIYAFSGGAERIGYTTSLAVSADTWHEVAITSNGTNVHIYLDGVAESAGTGIADFVSGSSTFRWAMHRASSSDLSLDGRLDEARITQADRYSGNNYTPTGPFPDSGTGTTFQPRLYLKTPSGNPFKIPIEEGYGGIRLDTWTPITIPTGDNWQILPTDTDAITVPENIIQSPANDAIAFQLEGVWNLNVGFTLVFDESQSGRNFVIRLFDVVTQTPLGTGTVVAVGRNTEAVTYGATIMVEIGAAQLAHGIAVQIGNASASFANITALNNSLTADLISAT